jgi:DivIVA domain-containing protein
VSDRPQTNVPDDAPSGEPDGRREADAGEAETTTRLVTLARPSELVPAEFRDVSFRPALAGYSRREVDEYVERVNCAIAELEISRSPEKAVQLALDRVAEQTAGILQEAGEAAERLTAGTLAESEHATRRAQVEAEELMEGAQSESRALLERSAAESAELLAEAQARLDELREAIGEAQDEHRRVLGRLRATAAALDSFAAGAEGGKPVEPEPSSADGDGDGHEDAQEQSTEVMAAIEPAADDRADDGRAEDDADVAASRAPSRRRITGTRQPRVPKREPARSGRERRAD